MLLDTLTFNPELIYDILGTIVIIITGAGFFFNSRSKIELLKNDLENTKSNLVKLEKSVGDTYSWSPSTGLSSTTVSNPTATVSSNTNYTVTETNSLGCKASWDST